MYFRVSPSLYMKKFGLRDDKRLSPNIKQKVVDSGFKL